MAMDVDGITVSPGYAYERAPDQEHFLSRRRTKELFREIFRRRGKAAWSFSQSPLFLAVAGAGLQSGAPRNSCACCCCCCCCSPPPARATCSARFYQNSARGGVSRGCRICAACPMAANSMSSVLDSPPAFCAVAMRFCWGAF